MTNKRRKYLNDNRFDGLTSEELEEHIVKYLVSGKTLGEIAKKLNVTEELVVETWKNYVSTQYNMPESERFLLHERRLEYMLSKAVGLIEQGLESEFGPKTLETALKVLDSLEKLQDLNSVRKREAESKVVEMTQKQVAQMLEILDSVKKGFAAMLPEMVQQNTKNYWTPVVVQEIFEQKQLEVMEERV